MARKKGIPGLSFSPKKALGISQAQSKFSRQIGVPLSRAGRQRKLGKAMGCGVFFAIPLLGVLLAGGALLVGRLG